MLEDVEREIRRDFRLLRFAAPVERQFESDTRDDRCRHMIRQNYIALLIYHCFLISDRQAIPDVFMLDLFVHFGVVTPVVLGINLLVARHPPVWIRESLEMLGAVILTLTIVVVVVASRAPDRDVVLFSVALVVLFVVIMQRVAFWYVVAASPLFQAFYGVGLFTIDGTTTERMTMSNFVVGGVILFTLVGAYNLERETRKSYLLALRTRFLNRDLEIASLRDALTGAGNRRALNAAFQRLAAPAGGQSSAILLLDIDHFKTFNDTNGHQCGDACLTRVAEVVADSIGDAEGAVYRFGGEEFLVLLETATLAHALIVAERIRSNVAGAQIPRGGDAGVVTVSVGVATGEVSGEAGWQALIAAADRALYTAKESGRNRISPFASGAPSPLTGDRLVA